MHPWVSINLLNSLREAMPGNGQWWINETFSPLPLISISFLLPAIFSWTKWATMLECVWLMTFWQRIDMADARICMKQQKLFNQRSSSTLMFNLKLENGMTRKTHSGNFIICTCIGFCWFIQWEGEGFRFDYLQKKRSCSERNCCLRRSLLASLFLVQILLS